MGNYCSCIDDHSGDGKIQEVEEVKREKMKFNSDPRDDEFLTVHCYSFRAPSDPKTLLVKRVSRRYISHIYLNSLKTLEAASIPYKLINGPPPTAPEIQMVEELLPVLPIPSEKISDDLTRLPTVELPNGIYYQGQWNIQAGKPEGFGIMVHSDQSKYIGGFESGKKCGHGRLIKMEGEVIEAEFRNDAAEGAGELIKANGTVFKGEFHKGKEHGEGIIEYQGSLLYSGSFWKGMKHGQGRLSLNEGNLYVGEFNQNLMEGYGTYVWADGKKYTGTWKANKLHGDGVYNWPDGREYKGCYADGNRDGYGIFKWPDGREYRGEWSKGNMHGLGTYTFIDKKGSFSSVKAIWDNGKKQKVLS